ncbi:hypothetical protein CI105_08165 [Candidatus Izimaplasma bacterium ZiA1]|uniref:polysaccharide pyruvyl transferase family protein n=1 Tax=Candidatus Izimoplasma sp. ZiA1 TaxID=2024899 RepID=UPI000BAA4262|nr:hypothetical protein CI105_08165 [Candidatus Izimaplasma bacterium ZiA1]
MKIGIITYHNAHNYGAALQTFALQKTLLKMHNVDEVEIINFTPNLEDESINRKIKILVKKILIKSIRCLPKKLFPQSLRRFREFNDFSRENMILTKKNYKSIDDLVRMKEKFNIVITGSDQVFNPDISLKSTNAYFLDFISDGFTTKASYAASFGDVSVLKKNIGYVIEKLSSFDYISIREKESVNILKDEFGINCVNSVDPTLLLTAKDWSEFSVDKFPLNGDYALVYILEKNQDTYKWVNYYSKILDVPVYNFSSDFVSVNEVGKLDWTGPIQFLDYFRNAKYIITNSFHGTIFSMIFNKDFVSLLPTKRADRIENMLEDFGVLDRAINISNVTKGNIFKSQLNYSLIEEKINTIRAESEKYLLEIIANSNEIFSSKEVGK